MAPTALYTRRCATALSILLLAPITERRSSICRMRPCCPDTPWQIARALLLVLLMSAFPAPAFSATIEADIEQDGVVISDSFGFAELATGEIATIAIYLVLQNGELASSFDADFDFSDGSAFDVVIDLGRVNPNLVPLGEGTWTDTEANIVGSQVRVSLSRESQGGESLVADIVVSPLETSGVFDLVLVDAGAAGDLDVPPYFIIVPIGTAAGTVLATLAVPEPRAAAQRAAVLLTLALLIRIRTRWNRSDLPSTGSGDREGARGDFA